jgi:hypothetical protein
MKKRMEKRVGYINKSEIDMDEIETELYFSGFAYKYIKTEELDYRGEDSIIYINYDMNTETHKIDMMNIHTKIRNLYTNNHTLMKIKGNIPENIENIYTGEIKIERYHENKEKYIIYIMNDEEKILEKMRMKEDREIREMLKIRDRFEEDIIMELVKKRLTRGIKYMIEWIEEKMEEGEREEIYNRKNKNNKTLYVMLIENGMIEIVRMIIKYITDENINTVDTKGNNIILEMITKCEKREYVEMIRKIIKRVRKEVIKNKESYYNCSIDDINESYIKDIEEYRDIYEIIKNK